jgi:hypothetical protein
LNPKTEISEGGKMSKGGIKSSYVMCHFLNGTSWKFGKHPAGASEEIKAKDKSKGGTNKIEYAKVKEEVAKYFGLRIATAAEMLKESTRTRTLKVGETTHQVKSAVKMGATGASRSVTVKFKKLTKIGGKDVASCKITMPSAYTMRDMITFVMQSSVSNNVAAIVSDKGNSWTFGTPYKPKKA